MEHLLLKDGCAGMGALAVCRKKLTVIRTCCKTESSPENQSAVSANHRSNVRITVSRNFATAPE
jgi:hypothetical protein